jgi:hypothetical protein
MLSNADVRKRVEDHVTRDEEGWSELAYANVGYEFEVENLGKITLVDLKPSGEGGGEYTHVVFRLVEEDGTDRLFKKTGCYQSHYGNDWDGSIDQCRAIEKVVTNYVTIR